jgi:DNA-binding response OmpR family regulator
VRILLYVDQRMLARKLRRCLEEESLAVDAIADGEDGDRKVRSGSYDAVILDEALALDDALELLELWRRDAIDVPVLMLGEGSGVAETVRCLDGGADDCLARPFQLAELMARLRALLRRRHQIPNPMLRTHDLEIDTATRVVKRSGREIRLTRREYALLEFLAFHRGRVVTRSMIWEHLYDEHDENTSNVVDVYIRYLRTKIDRGFDPPLILTRWGQGYLLRADEAPVEAPKRGRRSRSPARAS